MKRPSDQLYACRDRIPKVAEDIKMRSFLVEYYKWIRKDRRRMGSG